jgi:hypothetical protein
VCKTCQSSYCEYRDEEVKGRAEAMMAETMMEVVGLSRDGWARHRVPKLGGCRQRHVSPRCVRRDAFPAPCSGAPPAPRFRDIDYALPYVLIAS